MTSKYLAVLFLMMTTSASATFTLNVSTLGPASASVVISSPAGINCGSSNTACSASFAAGSTVTLTELVDSTSSFAGWGGSGGCSSNFTSCNVLMNTGKSVTAKFNPTLFLSLSGNGGGFVTDATGTVNCGLTNGCASGATTKASYTSGTYVTLTASAATNSTFTGWSGACSGTGTCGLTVDSHKVAVATFTSAGPFVIAVSFGGIGKGRVTSSPPGINCSSTATFCSGSFAANTTITFTATPSTGSYFAGWANGGCPSTSTCIILSTSAQQALGGSQSPGAFFYKN